MSESEDPAIKHCQLLVREADRDRYLASLFAPDQSRQDLWAIYAFNVEITRIREVISDPAVGEIRLQWWNEAIDDICSGNAPDHPVASALARTVARTDLPRHIFKNIIAARRFDLYDDPMPSISELNTYLEATSSQVIRLAAQALSGAQVLTASDVILHAGIAHGLTGVLRSMPIHAARGQCYLPLDLLESCGLTPGHILSRRGCAGVRVLTARLRHQALRRLAEARARQSLVPLPALPAFLNVGLVDGYLKKLANGNFNPLKTVANVSQISRQWRLMRMSFAEEF